MTGTDGFSGRAWSASVPMITTLLMVAACTSSPLQPEAQDNLDPAVEVTPDQVALDPGESRSFSARIRDSEGEMVPGQVEWEATGGTISKGGKYTAGSKPGKYKVKARGRKGKADSSDVVINSVPVSIVVQPARLVLTPGDTARFDVRIHDANGDSMSESVSWQGAGGQIDSEGTFVAGGDLGEFLVVGQTTNGLADTAVVVVDSEAPVEPATVSISPPQADLLVGSSVQFSAQLRDESGGNIDGAVVWSATGGTIDNEGMFTAGEQAGDFVTIVESLNGLADTANVTIREPSNDAPAAAFSSDCPELTCAFDASGSSDPDGTIVEYAWDFGDGSSGSGATTQHTYATTGSYAVVLTVTDDGGETGMVQRTVTIDPAGPQTEIYPGESIQQAVDLYPAGTEFLIKAGVHRLQMVKPKPGNTFVGEPGAIMSGARELTQFTREGSYWVAIGQDQRGQVHGMCDGNLQDPDGSRYTGCMYPEDLFIDDVALFQVVTKGAVGPGKWYFDYDRDKVYFYDDPTGKKVEISVVRHAFVAPASTVEQTADNVTIRGLIIEKYATTSDHGTVQAGLHDPGIHQSYGWIVEDCEIRLNHALAIRTGDAIRVIRNHLHHNGQYGIAGTGNDILIEGNEIAYNNTLSHSAGNGAGGTKLVKTQDLVVLNNFSHHNKGPGLWTDGDNIRTLYEGNTVTDNEQAGIFHEISYDAVIRYNVIERNGFETDGWLYGAGILIAHSPNVEVHGNTVRDNYNGIAGIQQPRGSGAYGPYDLDNFWVHDNEVRMPSGASGVAQGSGDITVFDRNLRFDRNTYDVAGNTKPMAWMNNYRTEQEWQQYGQDANGSFNR